MTTGKHGRFPFVDDLLRHWKSRHVPHLRGVTKYELAVFEQQHRVSLLPELRAFYLATNGTHVPDCTGADDKNFAFWPLDELTKADPGGSKMYFADVLMSAYQFAVDVDRTSADAGTVYAVPGKLKKVAGSFSEFIHLYIADDIALYPISWYK